MTAALKPTNRALQAAARRGEILRTALRLFASRGFAATSTKQIAREVGVAEGLIFRYFPDKRSLLFGLASQSDDTAASRALKTLDDSSGRPASEVLTAFAYEWLALSEREAQLTAMLLREAGVDPELRALVDAVFSAAVDRLADYLAKRIKAGELRIDLAVESAARTLIAALLAGHLLPSSRTSPALRAAEEIVGLWLNGAVVR